MGGLKINADAEVLDTQGNVIPGLYAAGETTGGTQSAGPYELRLPIFLQPLGGALKNRSAAPASPPCFRRRRRSAPLLFESTLESETSVFYKTKSPAYFHTLSIFGGRGWITQAAHLKRPRRGLFAAGTYSGGRCCSNPPARVRLTFAQKKTASASLHQRFFHGAKQPKSEPLPPGAFLAAISSKVMVFVPSL